MVFVASFCNFYGGCDYIDVIVWVSCCTSSSHFIFKVLLPGFYFLSCMNFGET
jgi:hypothetical protein